MWVNRGLLIQHEESYGANDCDDCEDTNVEQEAIAPLLELVILNAVSAS